MFVGKGRLLTDGLNRQRPKGKFLSVTNSLMSVYSEADMPTPAIGFGVMRFQT